MIRRIDETIISGELCKAFGQEKDFKVSYWHADTRSHYIHIRLRNRKYTVRISDHYSDRNVSLSLSAAGFENDKEVAEEIINYIKPRLYRKRGRVWRNT